MKILGVWDGHDAGAALVDTASESIVCAVNEERLTRRKLEISFPSQSITACLGEAGLVPGDIDEVVVSTRDPAKTLTRWFPSLKERYYLVRRRKVPPNWATPWTRRAKYTLTTWRPSTLSDSLSRLALRRELGSRGFARVPLHLVDHHEAHAACAAWTTSWDPTLVLTLDGVGDGLSGSASVKRNGTLKRIATIGSRDSLGVFFELVTQLMNMRELEDEGKVMALASYGQASEENPLADLFRVDGTTMRCRLSPTALRKYLAQQLSMVPTEQFAWMAQSCLETHTTAWVDNLVEETGIPRVVYAGGVASNIRVNLGIRELARVSELNVFPHMGDGGLALGAALHRAAAISKEPVVFELGDLRLGPRLEPDAISAALDGSGCRWTRPEDLIAEAADKIAAGDTVLWFQGRMEFGPRSLGGRSILARADRVDIKDRLNLKLKRRVWYQPFCPSLLVEEGKRLLVDGESPNRYMTMGYRVREEHLQKLAGVIGPDGTCRPQMVSEADGVFFELLTAVGKRTGVAAVLNTSLNLHGEPLVCTPADAVRTFASCGADWLVLGDFLVAGGR